MTTLEAERQTALPSMAAHTVLERAAWLVLHRHRFGNDRKIDVKDLVNAAAPDREAGVDGLAVDADQFTASRKLIDPKVLASARSVLSRAKAYLLSVSISGSHIFGESSYLVPLALAVEVDERLTVFAAEVFIENGKVADVYEAAVDAARTVQGPLFRADDYMSVADVRSAFGLDWDWISFTAPDRLETVDRALYERTRAKQERKLTAAFDEIVGGMRQDALDLVTGLEALVSPDVNGRRKGIRENALGKLADYIARLPQRNIGDDADLVAAMARVEATMSGVTVDALKDSAALRDAVRTTMADVRETLAGLVELAPRRAIAFGPIDG